MDRCRPFSVISLGRNSNVAHSSAYLSWPRRARMPLIRNDMLYMSEFQIVEGKIAIKMGMRASFACNTTWRRYWKKCTFLFFRNDGAPALCGELFRTSTLMREGTF